MVTHKTLINAIKKFKEKIEPLNSVIYSYDASIMDRDVMESEKMAFIFSIIDATPSVDTYKQEIRYGFSLIDKVGLSEDEVINSEEELLFIVGALEDYLYVAHGINTEFETSEVNKFSNSKDNSTETVIDGFFKVMIDKRPTVWGHLRNDSKG